MPDESMKGGLIARLQKIADEYDAWWTSPKGLACHITKAGLQVPELKGAIPWGHVKLSDLMAILGDNETRIHKAPLVSGREAGVPWPRFKPKPVDPKRDLRRVVLDEVPPMPVGETPF